MITACGESAAGDTPSHSSSDDASGTATSPDTTTLPATVAPPVAVPDGSGLHLRTIDNETAAYGTFQSHNQKIVENQYGIFASFEKYESEGNRTDVNCLYRSVDGGASWFPLFTITRGAKPYCVETDEAGNIFLIGPNWNDNTSWLYIFYAEDDFSAETMLSVNLRFCSGPGKYASYYVPETKLLWYVTYSGEMFIIDLEDIRNPVMRGEKTADFGTAKLGLRNIITYKTVDCIQYPSFYWTPEDHTMHLVWTTADLAVYHYRSIQYIRTRDNGETWQNMSGETLAVPINASTAPAGLEGRATKITDDAEDNRITWLQNFIVKNGRAHFIYRVADNSANGLDQTGAGELGMHYKVYDVNSGAVLIDRLAENFWGSGSDFPVNSLDGVFSTDRANNKIFYVSYYGNTVMALVTRDGGESWQGLWQQEIDGEFYGIYALGGAREVFNGRVIGSFTVMRPDMGSNGHAVQFFVLNVVE